MRTQVLSISNRAIKSYENSVTVTQLRDPSTKLQFRFSKVDRAKGSFYVRLYKNSKDTMIYIGKYPEISAQRAYQAIANIHLKEEHFNHNELILVGELCDWHVERTKSNRQIKDKTAKQTVSLIINHIKPYLAHLNIMSINNGLIDTHWFIPIQSKLALSTISLALVTLNAMFTWATKLKLISKNPVEKLSIANFTHQRPMVKVGRLNDKKLKACLANLSSLPIEKQMLLVLLLLHGTRIGETTKARWEDFDFDKMLWRIPASDTKTKKPHTLPLSPIAKLWLKAYRRYQYMNKRSKYLFPQQTNRRKSQSPNISSRTISNIAKGGWTAHDIRKYARSGWLENGVDYIIGEILLNHSLSKLDQSYIQTTAMNLCRDALTQWSEHLKGFGLAEPAFLSDKSQNK
jgi:integrase